MGSPQDNWYNYVSTLLMETADLQEGHYLAHSAATQRRTLEQQPYGLGVVTTLRIPGILISTGGLTPMTSQFLHMLY